MGSEQRYGKAGSSDRKRDNMTGKPYMQTIKRREGRRKEADEGAGRGSRKQRRDAV